MPTSSHPCALFLILLSIATTAFAAAGQPVRGPDYPGFVPAQPVNMSAEQMANLNNILRAELSASDPVAKDILARYPDFNLLAPDSENPPVNADGNYVIGPNYTQAPEYNRVEGVPQGKIFRLTMKSEDSKIYPGIDRDPGPANLGTVDPNNPYTLIVPTSHPAPYTRAITVYVPAQYVPGTPSPFIVCADGADNAMPTVLDNLIAQHRIPAIIAIWIAHGGRSDSDAQGSERGLEYDTMSGLYAEFVETEVLPLVQQQFNIVLTKDPDGRATMGSSSGGAAAFTMAWYHPELYHRVLNYSGTFVNQQWPFNPDMPHGAWEYPEHIIAESAVKPIRFWFEAGDRDNYNPNVMRDNMHDWLLANENMAKVLSAKGYHYQFVFALNAGHTDRNVRSQTLPDALEWLWQGYAPKP